MRVVSVSQANSSRIRIELPAAGADKLLAGYRDKDPLLHAFAAEFGGSGALMQIESVEGEQAMPRGTSDVTERGLETLIMRHVSAVKGRSTPADGNRIVPRGVV